MMVWAMGVIVSLSTMISHAEIALLIDQGIPNHHWEDYEDNELKWLELSYVRTSRDIESLTIAPVLNARTGRLHKE